MLCNGFSQQDGETREKRERQSDKVTEGDQPHFQGEVAPRKKKVSMERDAASGCRVFYMIPVC